ncbi:MAG TPA: tetratricopeptide repeat protein, partial [Acidimicrobiia bacterium]
MSWNLGHQARIATREGRLEDAIGLFGRSADRARELGYPRGVQASMAGLAEANVAAGDLRAAETAFIGSLAAAEQVSMVREMLGMMTKIASIRAEVGHKQEAVELLSTVLAEPTSVQRLFTDNAPISEVASAALTELQKELDPNEYSAAHASGTLRPYDVAAKELIDSLDTRPHTPSELGDL